MSLPKWEYLVLTTDSSLKKWSVLVAGDILPHQKLAAAAVENKPLPTFLDQLGKLGWELSITIPRGMFPGTMIFKRPAQEEPAPNIPAHPR